MNERSAIRESNVKANEEDADGIGGVLCVCVACCQSNRRSLLGVLSLCSHMNVGEKMSQRIVRKEVSRRQSTWCWQSTKE